MLQFLFLWLGQPEREDHTDEGLGTGDNGPDFPATDAASPQPVF